MIRLTLTDDHRLLAHAPLGPRDLSPAEVDLIRDAIEPRPLPWWLDWGAVAIGALTVAWVTLRGHLG